MKRATTDVLYFETGPDNTPTLHVEPGEEFEVQTQINRGPWLDNHPDREKLIRKLTGGNPSSGCIYVEGAEPGQMLIVHVGEIAVDPVGYTRFSGSTGAMPGWLGGTGVGAHSKVVEIKDGYIIWSDKLKIPATPMLGFVGAAPAGTRWHNGWCGEWGGNFDIPEITTGASVQLPVSVPGALLHIGDMHARQGGRRDLRRGRNRGRRTRSNKVRARGSTRVDDMAPDHKRRLHHDNWTGTPRRGRLPYRAVRDDTVARRRLWLLSR